MNRFLNNWNLVFQPNVNKIIKMEYNNFTGIVLIKDVGKNTINGMINDAIMELIISRISEILLLISFAVNKIIIALQIKLIKNTASK